MSISVAGKTWPLILRHCSTAPGAPGSDRDHMKRRETVGSRELKTRLGSHLKPVRQGVTLVITDRGHPIAELRPLETGAGDLESRLTELEAS
jgi:hypothetical protein